MAGGARLDKVVARLYDKVRDEAAEVVGDEVVGFADTDACGFLADDPAPEYGAFAVEVRKGEELLKDMTFFAILAGCPVNEMTRARNLDIGAFAGEDGFTDIFG